jgi:2'-5' RNA ligase
MEMSTTATNEPSSVQSPQGRRVLVAVVTGDAGERIQAWRQKHDPAQARRLPPHVTLCYWVPDISLDALERQVRHAFAKPVAVRLGGVHEFDNDEHTFYVEVLDTGDLDRARARLYDGAFAALPPLREWTWHVTCVRNARNRNAHELRAHAQRLAPDARWTVDTVSCMELRGDLYQPLATWHVGVATGATNHDSHESLPPRR